MKPADIPPPYKAISSSVIIPPPIDQSSTPSNLNKSNINTNSTLFNSNYVVQNGAFTPNSNYFHQNISTINQNNNHPNNFRFISKKRNKRQAIIKRKFTDSEDIALASLVEIHGQNNWKIIARNMPSDRTPRQCRERWKYYLSEGLPNNDDWTHEEEKLLLEKYEIYGPHWAKIAKFFNHKNDINLKNRFNKIKRNKLSGMLFDPSMSEEFDHVTRDKSKDPIIQDQHTTIQLNDNHSDLNIIDNNKKNELKDTRNEKTVVISPTNIDKNNFFTPLYYSNSAIDSANTQPSFSPLSESSSMQSSASSGKSSSNTSMLNSAHPEVKFPIIINTFNKNCKKDRGDSSESSGNSSASSGPPDANPEINSAPVSIGYNDKIYRNKIQYSVQSLLLNHNVIDENENDSTYNNANFNNTNDTQLKTDTNKSNEGCHKIIELPIPISLL